MVDYLKTILPRLQQYSKKLNDEANFADIPWAYLDEKGDKVTYIFRRNKELLVSKKGDVVTGHWEYLPMLQSLLIQYNDWKRMYNQGFLDNAVMILRKEGTDELLALANTQVIPNLDIVKYLENKDFELLAKNGPRIFRKTERFLDDNRAIVVCAREKNYGGLVNCIVVDKITGEKLPNGDYKLDDGTILKVRSGIILEAKSRWGQVSDTFFIVFTAIFLIVFIIILIVQLN